MLANRSLGHNVPFVNGHEQVAGPGGAAWARWEQGPQRDSFGLEFASAYPPSASLQRLERWITLYREGASGWVELHDEALFASAPGQFASVLVSLAPARLLEPGQLLFEGAQGWLRVSYDADTIDVRLETVEQVDLREGLRSVTRVMLQCKQASQAPKLRLQIQPGP
jgi:hypothetical protein